MKVGSCFAGLCGQCTLGPRGWHDSGPLHHPEELLGCSNFCRGGRRWGECIEVTGALPQEPEGGSRFQAQICLDPFLQCPVCKLKLNGAYLSH